MQYDENGYPLKGADSRQPNPLAPQQHDNEPVAGDVTLPLQLLETRREDSQVHRSMPRYDERGYPIKSDATDHLPPNRFSSQSSSSSCSSVGANRPPNAHASMGTRNFDGNNSFNRVMAANAANGQTNQGQLQLTQQGYLQPLEAPNMSFSPTQGIYWSTGLCDIADDWDVCIEGCLCYACEEGRLYSSLYNDKQNFVHPVACCATELCMCCFICVCPVVGIINRRKMVEKYNLKGEGKCTSYCFACVCPRCSACQVHRQLQLFGVYPGGVCCALKEDPNVRVVF